MPRVWPPRPKPLPKRNPFHGPGNQSARSSFFTPEGWTKGLQTLRRRQTKAGGLGRASWPGCCSRPLICLYYSTDVLFCQDKSLIFQTSSAASPPSLPERGGRLRGERECSLVLYFLFLVLYSFRFASGVLPECLGFASGLLGECFCKFYDLELQIDEELTIIKPIPTKAGA